MTDLFRHASELWWGLAIFAIAIPIEHRFSTGMRPAASERLGNLGAMLLNFVAGGLLLKWVLAQPSSSWLRGYPGAPRAPLLENPLLYGLAAVFLIDGLYYLYHRLQHWSPLLWRIHAIHHSDPAVNITTARRTHFLERPLQFLLLIVPVLWILGFNAGGTAIAGGIGVALLYFAHMDLRLSLGPLTPLIVGPQYHRIHHDLDAHDHGTNFAQAFPLFDLLGGTYRKPEDDEFVKTGVKEYRTTADRWRPLIW
ncbi:MAG TPA: sterol desaturase family protein [Candidatus Limnocylindrales bacterium]|nr:sterol desaturase family protein [Candidatus Limnocylindrales bacterium]